MKKKEKAGRQKHMGGAGVTDEIGIFLPVDNFPMLCMLLAYNAL
ncbi:hypothetical protein [Mitsuokella sp.]